MTDAKRDRAAELKAIVKRLRKTNEGYGIHAIDKACDDLSALAEAAPGEPVAWLYPNEERNLGAHGTALVYQQKQVFSLLPHEDGLPLYASPPLAPERATELLSAAQFLLEHPYDREGLNIKAHDRLRAAIAAMQATK